MSSLHRNEKVSNLITKIGTLQLARTKFAYGKHLRDPCIKKLFKGIKNRKRYIYADQKLI